MSEASGEIGISERKHEVASVTNTAAGFFQEPGNSVRKQFFEAGLEDLKKSRYSAAFNTWQNLLGDVERNGRGDQTAIIREIKREIKKAYGDKIEDLQGEYARGQLLTVQRRNTAIVGLVLGILAEVYNWNVFIEAVAWAAFAICFVQWVIGLFVFSPVNHRSENNTIRQNIRSLGLEENQNNSNDPARSQLTDSSDATQPLLTGSSQSQEQEHVEGYQAESTQPHDVSYQSLSRS